MSPKANSALKIRLPVWRARLVVTFIFLGFISLVGRAFDLQIWNTALYQAKANERFVRSSEILADRGIIRDRNGEELAVSSRVHRVIADPSRSFMGERPEGAPKDAKSVSMEQIVALADLLDIDAVTLEKFLSLQKSYKILKKEIPPQLADKVMSLAIPGIYLETMYKRFWPLAEDTAQLIGATSGNHVGQEGLELLFQSRLEGESGSRRFIKDNKGRAIDMLKVSEPLHGASITLSVDKIIQHQAYEAVKAAGVEHNAKSASIVVLDAITGEVLALSNWPSYNPNNRKTFDPEIMRNKAILDMFEPGSTIKPFTMAAALERGVIHPDSSIDIEGGRTFIGGRKVIDTHPKEGLYSASDVIRRSSNVGVAKISQMFERQHLWEALRDAGFGQKPETGFPGESPGKLTPPDVWKDMDHVSISFGYTMQVTLLQLARAYTIFAREGTLAPITFEKRTEAVTGERVISKDSANNVLLMMEKVTQEGGTATLAAVPGYRVAGKTGTTKKQVNGKYVKEYISSFVGLAPVSNPRVVIGVMVEDPKSGKYYGGHVAGPAFRAVMESALRQLGVTPDQLPNGIEVKNRSPQTEYDVVLN